MFGAKGPLTGIVRNLRRAEDAGSGFQIKTDRDQVLVFRLEQADASGEVSSYTQVEMRGRRIIGDIADGDRVMLPSSRSVHGVRMPRMIHNLTSQSRVYVPLQLWQKLAALIFIVIFLVVAAVIVTSFVDVFNEVSRFNRRVP